MFAIKKIEKNRLYWYSPGIPEKVEPNWD